MLIIVIYVDVHEVCVAYSGSLKTVHECFRSPVITL